MGFTGASRISNGGLFLIGRTAKWLGEIGEELAAKLASVGLMPERLSKTLGEFFGEYIKRRKAESKPNTIKNLERVKIDLTAFFGTDAPLRSITVGKAEAFKDYYVGKELAPATIYRQLKFAKMFFKVALQAKYITENPFDNVKGKSFTPNTKLYYISEADTYRLLDAANPTWRTIIALSRFGGLRNPSEVLSLKWAYVNLISRRMVVISPKTEHLEGKDRRVVPIFPRLRPILEEAYELAEPGEVFVVGGKIGATFRVSAGDTWMNANMRTTLLKIIHRAGLLPWPKPFHNMRASCETDLAATEPIHLVTAWLGNTPKIAQQHYLQTLDSDVERVTRDVAGSGAESGAVVVQKAVQTVSTVIDREKTNATESLENMAFRRVLSDSGRYYTND